MKDRISLSFRTTDSINKELSWTDHQGRISVVGNTCYLGVRVVLKGVLFHFYSWDQ